MNHHELAAVETTNQPTEGKGRCQPNQSTLTAVEEVGIAAVAGGAVAEVSLAPSVLGVDALAVAADAGVGRRVALGLLARLVPLRLPPG